MAFARYPHSGTISYFSGSPTVNSIGVFTPGTITTMAVICRVEANRAGFIINGNGIRIDYTHNIYCPKLSYETSLQDGVSKFMYAGMELTIVQVPPFQKTTVLRVK